MLLSILTAVLLFFCNAIYSEDICSGVNCQHGGTCVNRTIDFWWCECEKGWTGRHCEYNACHREKYVRIPEHKLDLHRDKMMDLDNPYVCMDYCRNTSLLQLGDSKCKSVHFKIEQRKCMFYITENDDTISLREQNNYDYFRFCECNEYFEENPHFKNTTLSPKCYMTNSSSVVELTCQEGYVFAENGKRTLELECVCKENIGYPDINAACLPAEVTTEKEAATVTSMITVPVTGYDGCEIKNTTQESSTPESIIWETWSSWNHVGTVGHFQRKMHKNDPHGTLYQEQESKHCECITGYLRKDKQLLDHVLSTISVRTNVECLQRCCNTLGCVSVNWEKNYTRCQLNDAEISGVSCRDTRESPGVMYYWLDVGGCEC